MTENSKFSKSLKLIRNSKTVPKIQNFLKSLKLSELSKNFMKYIKKKAKNVQISSKIGISTNFSGCE